MIILLVANLLHIAVAAYAPPSVQPYHGASLVTRLEVAGSWNEVMEALRSDDRFYQDVWSRQPMLFTAKAGAGAFTVAEIRAAADAGELVFGPNAFLAGDGQSFRAVRDRPNLSPFTPEVLESGLLNGTMVINDAASAFHSVFEFVQVAVRVLQIPVNANVYVTHPTMEHSAPLHTDRQDVLVVQCEGSKHWRVYPPLIRFPMEHQERGKGGDVIDEGRLGPPLFEGTLTPGQVLYVPRGFVHTTGRHGGHGGKMDVNAQKPSTSLTIGLQTESMGLTYDKLLMCMMVLHGQGPTLEEQRALSGSFELLRMPLPLPGSFLDRPSDASSPQNPLERAGDELLDLWSKLQPGQLPPPRQRMLRASKIMAEGHREIIRYYEDHMFNASIPRKLRQLVWHRQYEGLVYRMLGRCGFLTRCFPKKFWLPKHTTHQRCWGSAESA